MITNHRTLLITLGLILLPGIGQSQLPTFKEQPWLGFHSGYAFRKFEVGLTPDGILNLIPLNDKSERVGPRLHILIKPTIMVESDGKPAPRPTQTATLASADSPSGKFTRVTWSATAEGGGKFEAVAEIINQELRVGIRQTDKGSYQLPSYAALRIIVPQIYAHEQIPPGFSEREGNRDESNQMKKFLLKFGKDNVSFTQADGKRVRAKLTDLGMPKINPTGLQAVELDSVSYSSGKLILQSDPGSLLDMQPILNPRPLFLGMNFSWKPDESKDPQHKSRLRLSLK